MRGQKGDAQPGRSLRLAAGLSGTTSEQPASDSQPGRLVRDSLAPWIDAEASGRLAALARQALSEIALFTGQGDSPHADKPLLSLESRRTLLRLVLSFRPWRKVFQDKLREAHGDRPDPPEVAVVCRRLRCLYEPGGPVARIEARCGVLVERPVPARRADEADCHARSAAVHGDLPHDPTLAELLDPTDTH